MKAYFPSTTPGKTWSISFYKPARGPGVISAIEGEYKHADAPGGFSSFNFTLFEARSYKQTLDGPATAKKKQAAFDALVASMKAKGLIPADAVAGVPAKAAA